MKKIFLLLFTCSLFSSTSSAHNMFYCISDEHELSFATTSFLGIPTLSMNYQNNTINFYEVEINKSEKGLFFSGKSNHGQISFTAPEHENSFAMKASIGCSYVNFNCSGSTVYF